MAKDISRGMDEKSYIRKVQWLALVSSALVILILTGSLIRGRVILNWKDYQEEFIQLTKKIGDSLEIPASFEKGIYQVELAHFSRIDRCISCHSGLENPVMANAPQPHRQHPGNFLSDHPVERFGCTVCHGGQGRALTKEEAFGLDPGYHWPRPLLGQPYIQSSCGKCHLSIYNSEESLEGTGVFRSGQVVFTREGCLGCHKARGVGGIIGPDLTEQGEKTKHEYSFQNVRGEQTVSNWLKEHFRDPEMVSPGSNMLKIDLQEDELDALATFVMGLAKPDMPLDYFSIETLNELKGYRRLLEGAKVYSFTCSACHGKVGEGKDYKSYKTGVPSIMNHDFLRVASEEFILFTLMKGRSLRQMSSWDPGISGWKEDEILSLVTHLKQQLDQDTVYRGYPKGTGNPENGNMLYRENCQTCHGENGNGGAALALNKKDFLARADRSFIYQTIVKGRNNSGMPGWPHLQDRELLDLLALLNSWYRIGSEATTPSLPEGNADEGALRYHYLCSRCHGDFGDGETGPAIMDPDFLEAASDIYLYETIAKGRSHTAMFGWSKDVFNLEQLDTRQIADLIAFMRLFQENRPAYIFPGSNPGNTESGKELFSRHCSTCHGMEGEGREAPALNNQEFLSAASNGYLLATITVGRKGTRMPSWGYPAEDHPELAGNERQDLVAFIRTWQRIRIRK